jgi:pantoate--beta-alanine ligase
MKVWPNLAEWRAARRSLSGENSPIGFVPTLGALHTGHRALLARAKADNDCVVLSIFVNPTQFNDQADLAKYPRTLEADLAIAAGLVDHVILPTAEEIYPDNYAYRLTEESMSRRLEGAHRPGHFDGVLTVVLKLLNIVQPARAYFGEKDWQQLRLVEGMVRALFLPVEIIACPTERDRDGLALSSRNRRLSAAARQQAALFPRILLTAPTAATAVKELAAAGFAVDYVAEESGVRLGAVRVDNVRLIDNVRI